MNRTKLSVPLPLVCAARGWSAAVREWRLALLLLSATLVITLPAALGLIGYVQQSFPGRPAFDSWFEAPSYGDFRTLRRTEPAVLGDLSFLTEAISKNGIRSFQTVTKASGLGAAALATLFLGILLNSLFAAVILSRFHWPDRDRENRLLEMAAQACSRYGPVFIALLLPVLLFDLATYWMIVVRGGLAAEKWFPENGTERLAIAITWVRYGMWGIVTALAHRLLDHARISIVATDDTSALRAITRSARVVIGNPIATLGVAAFSLFPLALVGILWLQVADFIRPGSAAALLFLFLVHQAIFFTRQFQKCATLFAEVRFQQLVAAEPVTAERRAPSSQPAPGLTSSDLQTTAAELNRDGTPNSTPSGASPARTANHSEPEPPADPKEEAIAWPARIDEIEDENRRAAEDEERRVVSDHGADLPAVPVVLHLVEDDENDAPDGVGLLPDPTPEEMEFRSADSNDGEEGAGEMNKVLSWPGPIDGIEEENRRAAEDVGTPEDIVADIEHEPVVLRPADDDEEIESQKVFGRRGVARPAQNATAWSAQLDHIDEENAMAAEDDAQLAAHPPSEFGLIPSDALTLSATGAVDLGSAGEPDDESLSRSPVAGTAKKKKGATRLESK